MSQGLPPESVFYQQPPARPGAPGMAVASLVLGIVSLALFCVWYVAIPAAVLAIVFGILARSKAPPAGGRGMATAGIVCGSVAIVVVVLLVVAFGVFFMTAGRQMFQQIQRQQQMQMQQYQQQQAPASQPVVAPTTAQ